MIIFLHGDDTYRSRQKLRELKERFLREVDPSGANLAVIDGATANASDIWAAIAAQSFLVRKRLVVVEDLGQQKSKTVREEVAAFLNRIPEDAIAVFYEQRSVVGGQRSAVRSKKQRPAQKNKTAPVTSVHDPLFSLFLTGKYVEEFTPLAGTELDQWIRERAAALGATIAPDALRLLVAEVGSDLWRLTNEMEKLAAAAQQPLSSRGAGATRDLTRTTSGTVITPDLIRSLVFETPPDNIFVLADALGSRDRAAAFCCLRELEAARVDPQYLVAMLVRQFRLLIAAADLLERGATAAQLSSELNLKPFVARKLIQQSRCASLPRLRALFLELTELDAQLKSSRAPWPALIELFCAQAAAEPTAA